MARGAYGGSNKRQHSRKACSLLGFLSCSESCWLILVSSFLLKVISMINSCLYPHQVCRLLLQPLTVNRPSFPKHSLQNSLSVIWTKYCYTIYLWIILKMIKINLLYDLAILLLGIWKKASSYSRYIRSSMFTDALVTITSKWK